MEKGKVRLLIAMPKAHDCQLEIVRALPPATLDTLGPDSVVQCSCDKLFIRAGSETTGYFWAEPPTE